MGDLRQAGLHALAVRMHADADLQPAVRRDAPGRLLEAGHHGNAPGGKNLGAVRGLFGIGGEADADQPAIRLALLLALAHGFQVDVFHRAAQAFREIAAVEMLARDVVVGHGFRRHEVQLAYFMRLAADRAGDGVDGQLDGEAHAGPRHAAVGRKRRLVGGDRPGLAAVGVQRVRAGQIAAGLGGLDARGERPHRIGADIDGDLGVERQQPAALVGVSGDPVVMLAGVGADHQMLAAVLDPAHRVVELQRRPGDEDLFGVQHALVAEAAADVGRDHPDIALLQPQTFGQPGAHHVRHLGRHVNHELVVLVVAEGEHRQPFQGHHALAVHAVFALDLHRRGFHHGFDIAIDGGLQEQVIAPFVVHQRPAGFARRQHIDDRRQILDVENNLFGQILGLGAGVT